MEMTMLKEYSDKFGLSEVTNDMGECRKTRPNNSIVFRNGWVASIIPTHDTRFEYSVAMCDYNGYFNWSILNNYGAHNGHFTCESELDIIIACETIRRLPEEQS